mgnify:FL=1|tara:strand:- start:54 stop:656 length:603 start_codon:yes stop_codon:yes gene_type:complete
MNNIQIGGPCKLCGSPNILHGCGQCPTSMEPRGGADPALEPIDGTAEAAPAQQFGIIDPDYARIFTQARIVAWQFGYACVAHGSFTRDLDLLLVPWADRHVPDAGGVVKRIADVAGLRLQGPPSDKPHGRKAWTLLLPEFSEVRWVDVSAIAPAKQSAQPLTEAKLMGLYMDFDRTADKAWSPAEYLLKFGAAVSAASLA